MIENEEISPGIIEQYVLGLCSPEDQLAIELMRQKNPDLDKSIHQFELQFEKAMISGGTLPSKETDLIILSTLTSLNQSVLKQAPVITPVVAFNKGNIRKKVKFVAVAASILFLIGLGYYFIGFFKYKSQQTDLIARKPNAVSKLLNADLAVLNNPNITTIAMNGVGIHMICRCTMFWNKKTGKVYIMIHHLPLSDNTKDYQLWANVNGKPISVGIIDDSIRGQFIQLENMPLTSSTFSVTLEKAGGSSTPTEAVTYLRGKI